AHYRSPIDFSDQNLNEARAGLERIYACLAAIDVALGENPAKTVELSAADLPPAGVELQEKSGQMLSRFKEAMDDDFNTAQALGIVFEVVRSANRFMAEMQPGNGALTLLQRVRSGIAEITGVL